MTLTQSRPIETRDLPPKTASRLVQLTRQHVLLSRDWYLRRQFRFNIGNLSLTFLTEMPRQLPNQEETTQFEVRIQEDTALLDVPQSLINEVCSYCGVSSPKHVSESSLLLLLEYLLADTLSSIEAVLGKRIVIVKLRHQRGFAARPSLLGLCTLKSQTYPVAITLQDAFLDNMLPKIKGIGLKPAIAGDLLTEIAFRAGMTRLTLGLLKKLKPGDVILGDQMLKTNQAIAVFGEKRLGIAQVENQRITLLTRPTQVSKTDEGVWSMSETTPSLNGSSNEPDSKLDDIQIKLLFEIARTEISLDQLRSIAPGYVFDFTKNPKTAIEIYAGSRRIGYGEVVQVGDALGVRVTRLFEHE